jgi:hypothetical protein
MKNQLVNLNLDELEVKLNVINLAILKAKSLNDKHWKQILFTQKEELELIIGNKKEQVIKMNTATLSKDITRTVESPVKRIINSYGVIKFECKCGCEITMNFDKEKIPTETCICGTTFGVQVVVLHNRRRENG